MAAVWALALEVLWKPDKWKLLKRSAWPARAAAETDLMLVVPGLAFPSGQRGDCAQTEHQLFEQLDLLENTIIQFSI